MSPLTPKQKQVFDYIARHIERQGVAPSQQEIAEAFGFRSLGTVQNYLVRLEREGLLQRDWNARRSLRLAAVPPAMVGSGEHFVLRVAGDSMIEDGILDGDYVVVRKQADAEHGQTVVALLDNEATVKRLQLRGTRIELHPANPAMRPIIVDDPDSFRIEGVVVGVIRHYR
jgi:repressor LexA